VLRNVSPPATQQQQKWIELLTYSGICNLAVDSGKVQEKDTRKCQAAWECQETGSSQGVEGV
jgi:hypothetical protein